jgi:hypothetical protein
MNAFHKDKIGHSTPQSDAEKPLAFFQPKLTVNTPGDPFEQEADAMADQVMRKTHLTSPKTSFLRPKYQFIQQKCASCDEEDKVHRKENKEGETLGGPELDEYVGSLGSSGQALSESSRQFFESQFGRDFSHVRIHHDTVAAKSAQSINAHAYTSGNHIVFNSGQYSPESDTGKHLLAHELTHVVQQGSSIPLMAQREEGTNLDIQEESPCEKASLKNERSFPCPDGGFEIIPCAWTMFKNVGQCDLTISYIGQGDVITVEAIDPGAVTEIKPSKKCKHVSIKCVSECNGQGKIKWGPPCIV